MALNFLSKLGIIIGVFTILTSLLIFLAELPRIVRTFESDDTDIITPISFKVENVGLFILDIVACVLSFVLLLGIVKKHHLLLVPWLVVGFLLSVYLSSILVYDTVTRIYFNRHDYFSITILIGSEITVLYPIWQLFTEIRRGNAAVAVRVGGPKESKSRYVHNVKC